MKRTLTKISLLAGIILATGAATSAHAQCSSGYGAATQVYVTTPAPSSCSSYSDTRLYTQRVPVSVPYTSSCQAAPVVQYVRPVTSSSCSQKVYRRQPVVVTAPVATRVVVTPRPRHHHHY